MTPLVDVAHVNHHTFRLRDRLRGDFDSYFVATYGQVPDGGYTIHGPHHIPGPDQHLYRYTASLPADRVTIGDDGIIRPLRTWTFTVTDNTAHTAGPPVERRIDGVFHPAAVAWETVASTPSQRVTVDGPDGTHEVHLHCDAVEADDDLVLLFPLDSRINVGDIYRYCEAP